MMVAPSGIIGSNDGIRVPEAMKKGGYRAKLKIGFGAGALAQLLRQLAGSDGIYLALK